MDKPILTALLLLTASLPASAETPWTYCTSEGEDATSHHYYFFAERGARVERVRWVWNGGCCNAPKVTDYDLQSAGLIVRHLAGEREDIPELIAGRQAPLTIEREHTVVLTPRAPDAGTSTTTLDRQQAVDLANLVDLLARERPPQPTDSCQPPDPTAVEPIGTATR